MLYGRVTILDMHESADPNQRSQVCDELWTANGLSIEDIQALRKATGDLDPEVAAAARKALFVHGQSYSASDLNPPSTLEAEQGPVETKPKSWRDLTWKRKALVILGVLVGLMVYILVISEGGRTAIAICTRFEPNGPVNCVRELSIFWIIPLHKMEISNVKSVIWDEMKWYDEGWWYYAYSIEFDTDQGQFPFSPYHSGGGPKLKARDALGSFLNSNAPGTLIVTDPGALTWDTLEFHGLTALLCISLFVYVVILLPIWEKRKTWFHRD